MIVIEGKKNLISVSSSKSSTVAFGCFGSTAKKRNAKSDLDLGNHDVIPQIDMSQSPKAVAKEFSPSGLQTVQPTSKFDLYFSS